VLHIDLAKWADIFVIAPCSANTLAKLAYGICDNLLTSVARAWDADRPLVIAPAMNTHMWTHPHTAVRCPGRKLAYGSDHAETHGSSAANLSERDYCSAGGQAPRLWRCRHGFA